MADIETPTWRNKQKIGQMMTRLQQHGFGELEMTNSQIQAAKLYLSKTLPDLNKTVIQGDPDKPLVQRIERVIKDPNG